MSRVAHLAWICVWCGAAAACCQGAEAIVVQPVRVHTTATHADGWSLPDATWNGSGFSQPDAARLRTGEPWPAFLPAARFDGTRDSGSAWFATASMQKKRATCLAYDLGDSFMVSAAAVWNYRQDRPTRRFDMWATETAEPDLADVSEAGGWKRIVAKPFFLSVWSGPLIGSDEILYEKSVPARWIAVTGIDPFVAGNDAGIEEIRFKADGGRSVSLSVARPQAKTLSLNPLFSNHAVVQQGMPVPVWGTSRPADAITVLLGDRRADTQADAEGRWLTRLEPLEAGGPHTLEVRTATETVTRTDILVGEVWFCSGQSNMAYPLGRGAAPDPMIRLLHVPPSGAAEPRPVLDAQWVDVTPETSRGISAVGYAFIREIRLARQVPVGLIQVAWPGSGAEAWVSLGALRQHPELAVLATKREAAMAAYPQRLLDYQARLPDLRRDYAEAVTKYDADVAATATGAKPPAPPRLEGPPEDPATVALPGHAFHGMLAPLMPYAVRGGIWYQGESNALGNRSWQYQFLLPAMISDWRAHWGQGDFPVHIVQLPPTGQLTKTAGASRWAELREAQRLASLQVPHCGLAVTTDLGSRDIHPRTKEPIGQRLALLARALTYGEQVECSGPVFKGIKGEGTAVRVFFTHADDLEAGEIVDEDGTRVATSQVLDGFTLAGEDKIFHAANAAIDGATVLVSSTDVARPVAVRYGWADYPSANLRNRAGLWASPFRSDDWRMITQPAEHGPRRN